MSKHYTSRGIGLRKSQTYRPTMPLYLNADNLLKVHEHVMAARGRCIALSNE